jgi:hypothetical protein
MPQYVMLHIDLQLLLLRLAKHGPPTKFALHVTPVSFSIPDFGNHNLVHPHRGTVLLQITFLQPACDTSLLGVEPHTGRTGIWTSPSFHEPGEIFFSAKLCKNGAEKLRS